MESIPPFPFIDVKSSSVLLRPHRHMMTHRNRHYHNHYLMLRKNDTAIKEVDEHLYLKRKAAWQMTFTQVYSLLPQNGYDMVVIWWWWFRSFMLFLLNFSMSRTTTVIVSGDYILLLLISYKAPWYLVSQWSFLGLWANTTTYAHHR